MGAQPPRRIPSSFSNPLGLLYFNERFFEQIDDNDKAYLVGFVLGDGTLIDRGSSKRLQIGLADDDGDLLEAIARRLGDVSLVERAIPARTLTEKPKALLRIDSARLVEDLMFAGVPLGKKSGQEPFLEFGEDWLTWGFIRGVFDADGSIRVYERSGFVKGILYGPHRRAKWAVTCGKPFVQGLCRFLLDRGFELSEKCIQPKQGTSLIETADQDLIRPIGAEMYRHGSLWLRRKRDTFHML